MLHSTQGVYKDKFSTDFSSNNFFFDNLIFIGKDMYGLPKGKDRKMSPRRKNSES